MPKFRQKRNWKILKKFCPSCQKEYGWSAEKCRKCGAKLSIKFPSLGKS